MSEDIVIEVENLACKSGVKYLLQNINWQVSRGEQWAVFGATVAERRHFCRLLPGIRAIRPVNCVFSARNTARIIFFRLGKK